MTDLRNSYAIQSKYEAFYTGGKIQISKDGEFMFCGCGNAINVIEITTGKIHSVIGENEDEEISCFCLSPDDQYIVIATQNLLLRQWQWKEKSLIRTWKSIHVAPVVSMAFDCTSTLLATGSADSTIKLWDIEKKYCTHNLRGHQGIVSALEFHPDISRLQLFSAGEDYKVRVWDLSTSQCIAAVAAHYSIVTAIVFSLDGNTVYSSSRDGVVAVWDGQELTVKRTIPVFEIVESIVLLPEGQDFSGIGVDTDQPHIVTAGSKGVLRVWNTVTSQCVHSVAEAHTAPSPAADDTDKVAGNNIVQTVISPVLQALVVVSYDHNISLRDLPTLALRKQFAGYNDEILDLKYFGEDQSHVIVVTNSMHIKVFNLNTWDCDIVYGHKDIVMSVDVFSSKNLFVSGSKDNTVRVWKYEPGKKTATCLTVGQGHTHTVGAVAFSCLKPSFIVSGSEDSTLKLWKLPADLDQKSSLEMHASQTERAHDDDISTVAVAPNDRFIASGSMDKTAKLWNAEDLSLLGIMRGHKRGIWCVQFSPVDKALASSSGDGTIKIWSLSDFTCVKTFEGHDCAVLKVTFVTRGMQLLSCATDGLVKLWTIKSNECVKTMDEHQDKAWALMSKEDGASFLSGGADSKLILWKDVTQTEVQEARAQQERQILQEQQLSNLIQQKKYLKAIGLAITLEQPFRVLTIIKEILSGEGGADELHATLEKLRLDQLDAILRFAVKWNTNSRHCHEAQYVLSVLLKTYPAESLRKFPSIKSTVEALVPYTERHFQRMNRLLQQSMFVEYTWQCMRNMTTDSSLASASRGMAEDRFALGTDGSAGEITPGQFDCETGDDGDERNDTPVVSEPTDSDIQSSEEEQVPARKKRKLKNRQKTKKDSSADVDENSNLGSSVKVTRSRKSKTTCVTDSEPVPDSEQTTDMVVSLKKRGKLTGHKLPLSKTKLNAKRSRTSIVMAS